MEMRAFIVSGRERQLVLPLLRLHQLRGEWCNKQTFFVLFFVKLFVHLSREKQKASITM